VPDNPVPGKGKPLPGLPAALPAVIPAALADGRVVTGLADGEHGERRTTRRGTGTAGPDTGRPARGDQCAGPGRARAVEPGTGRRQGALAHFETAIAIFGSDLWGLEIRDVGYLHARSGTALALLLLGDRARARELAESELSDARAFGGRRALGIALRVAGLAAGATAGVRLLTESVTTLRESPALLERAKSLTELGAALRRAGQRSAARPPLTEALDLAASCGARPLAERARAELTAAGGRPRRERSHGAQALTPSELRVARLAANGYTNRQIAYSLYVTPKTVETHLAHTYTKLGISDRGELPEALPGENLGVPTPTRTDGDPRNSSVPHR
jgi:DNA-binding CsgD family transcriptional regulator